MAYLAFRRDRVLLLRIRMAVVADGLNRARRMCTADQWDLDTVRAVRRALDALELRWLPFADRLLADRSLVDPIAGPPAASIEALLRSRLRAHGWHVETDPLQGIPTATVAEAVALAEAINAATPGELLGTPQARVALGQELAAVLRSPEARRAFAATFTEWSAALTTLAVAEHQLLAPAIEAGAEPDPGRAAGAAAIRRTIGALGTLLTERPVGEVEEILAGVHPYVAALTLTALRLPDATFGRLAAAVLARHFEGPSPPWALEYGGTAGELLMPLLAARPAAARAAVLALGEMPLALFYATSDVAYVEQVLALATDPATTSAREAGAILAGLVDCWRRWRNEFPRQFVPAQQTWAAMIGRLCAPWVLWFGHRHAAFGWTAAEGRARLAAVVGTPAGAAEFVAHSEEWFAPIIGGLLVPPAELNYQHVDDYAETMAMIATVLRRAELAEAAKRRLEAVPLTFVLHQLPGLIQIPVPVVGAVVGVAASKGVDEIDGALQRWGVLPPEEGYAQALAAKRFASRTIAAAIVLYVAVAEQLVRAGRIPPQARRHLRLGNLPGRNQAAAVREAMTRFANALRDANAARTLLAIRDAMLSATTIELLAG